MSTSCGWEGKGRYGSMLIPLADETQGVQVKLLSLDNAWCTWAP